MALSYTTLVIFILAHDYLDLIIKKSEWLLYEIYKLPVYLHHG